MSRILRRPMFRGGRVDGRGTGITSNLGYKKGGSVNTPRRGLVNQPGGYAGTSTTEGFKRSPIAKGFGWLDDYLLTPWANQFNQLSIKPFTGLFGYGDWPPTGATPLNTTKEEWQEIVRSKEDPPTGILGPPDGGRTTQGTGEDFYLKPEGPSDAELALAELKALRDAELADQKGPKETIEEYKEVFKDAYGSGKADDASAMLLNFAGKALKPEATVKSAFGDFFEEEGKRPSESKKYKDAATTAAINAYLTGEKSFQDTMRAIKVAEATTRSKVKILAEGKGWDDYLVEAAGSTGDPRKMGVINYAIAKMGEEQGGKLPKLEEGQTYGEILKEGPIYVQDSPDGSFKILVKWDGEKLVPIKEIYKLR